jgi:carboxypeptidase T
VLFYLESLLIGRYEKMPNKYLISKAILVHAGTKESSERVGVYITGGMHAREWCSSDICINVTENLLTAFKKEPSLSYGVINYSNTQIKTTLKNIDLYIFPDVNPDEKNIFNQIIFHTL